MRGNCPQIGLLRGVGGFISYHLLAQHGGEKKMAWKYIIKIKPYWDELNGNSYHSGAIFDIATETQVASIPFGYGDEQMGLRHAYNVIWGLQEERLNVSEIRKMCFTTLMTDTGEQDCRDYGKECK